MIHQIEPLVSICCITYNHAAFIRQALDGFVQQRTTFPFEVIVHDDASTDGTAEIIREYAARWPEMIRPIIQKENQYSKAPNYVLRTVFEAACGRYIAYCEGDDHWVDPLKLQKQVEALQEDTAAVGCFMDAWNEHDGKRTPYMGGDYAARPAGRIVPHRAMVMGQNIPACTFLFRRECLFPLPDVMFRSPVGDTILYAHLTRMGHLIFLPEFSAVRVMHMGGVHSLKDFWRKTDVSLKVIPLLDELTEGRFHHELDRNRLNTLLKCWEFAVKESDKERMGLIWKLLLSDPLWYGSAMFSKNVLDEHGIRSDASWLLSAEEYLLMLSITDHAQHENLPDRLIQVRSGDPNQPHGRDAYTDSHALYTEVFGRFGLPHQKDEVRYRLLLHLLHKKPVTASDVHGVHTWIRSVLEWNAKVRRFPAEHFGNQLWGKWDAIFHYVADGSLAAGTVHLVLSRYVGIDRWSYLLKVTIRRWAGLRLHRNSSVTK